MHRKRKAAARITASLLACCLIGAPWTSVTASAQSLSLDRMNQMTAMSYAEDYQLTREDFFVVTAKMFATSITADNLPFADADQVQPENRPYLAALYQIGMIEGSLENGALYLRPRDPITRQEAVTLLGRVKGGTSDMELPFSDSDKAAVYAYRYIAWFAENKVITGYPDGTLRPGDVMTAGELAALTVRTYDLPINGSDNIQSSSEPDVETDQPKNISPAAEAIIATYAGIGSRGTRDADLDNAQFTLPYGVLTNDDGQIIVFDTYNNLIRVLRDGRTSILSGKISSINDEYRFPKGFYKDAAIQDALFSRPTDGVIDSKGNIYVTDSENHVIRCITDGKTYTFCGSKAGYRDGNSQRVRFNHPSAIAIDRDDNLYVADSLNNCIRKITPTGQTSTLAGIPGREGYTDGAAEVALFRSPEGIAVSEDGSVIYVSDTGNHRIRVIKDGEVSTLAGITPDVDEEGSPLGGFSDGSADVAEFNLPIGLTLADGLLIVADSANNRIRAITQTGEVFTLAGNGEPGDHDGEALGAMLHQPMGVYYNGRTIYIADTGNNKIKAMDLEKVLDAVRKGEI